MIGHVDPMTCTAWWRSTTTGSTSDIRLNLSKYMDIPASPITDHTLDQEHRNKQRAHVGTRFPMEPGVTGAVLQDW